MPDTETVDVSILIISFNTIDLTRACLASVYAEAGDHSFEVIVVDNDSADGSAGMVRSEFPQATLFALDENLGFGRANNLAAEHAAGDRVLLLNSDTVVLDGAIDRLLDFADAHPEARVYGGRSLFADGSLNPTCCWGKPTLWNEFCLASGLSSVFAGSTFFNGRYLGDWQRDSVREVDVISGSYLLMDAPLWAQLEGFDTRFFMYGEDVDLCLRANQAGGQCLFTPASQIIHHGGGSERVVADKMVRLLKAKVQLYEKHWSRTRQWLATTPRKPRRSASRSWSPASLATWA